MNITGVIDLLHNLFTAQQEGPLWFLDSASSLFTRNDYAKKQWLHELASQSRQRVAELAAWIQQLGETLIPQPTHDEEQFLSYLAIDFLIKKIQQDLNQCLALYNQALAMTSSIESDLRQTLASHAEQIRTSLTQIAKGA